jgi:hypothetical protein
LPPLGADFLVDLIAAFGRNINAGRLGAGSQNGDRVEQFAAVAYRRDAKLFQVLCRQIR